MVLQDALALNESQRELLVAQLVESLLPGADEDGELEAEVTRRLAAWKRGDVSAIPWSVARRSVFPE